MFEEAAKKIEEKGILPVIKVENADDALCIARSLRAGGLNAMELTFRTANGEEGYERIGECIRLVSEKEPDMLVGAGTVLNPFLAKRAMLSGAKFIVSPGFNSETVEFCLSKNFPVFPGVYTPSEIEVALSHGLRTLKFFPADSGGGIPFIKAMAGPFADVKFICAGGINLSNLESYMRLSNVSACCMSQIAENQLIEKKDWAEITRRTKECMKILKGIS